MPDSSPLALSAGVIAAVAAIVVGFAAFWSNPRRTVNRAFFAASLHVAFWLICVNQAVKNGPDGQTWLRTASIVGAFIIMPLWFIKEVVASGGELPRTIWARSIRWVSACAAIASLSLTEWFVARESSKENPGIGAGYYVFTVCLVVLFGFLCRDTLREARAQTGLKRLELQIVLLGGSAAAFAVIFLMVLRGVTHWSILVELIQPLVVLLFYAGTAVAITTSRVFNARQILAVGFQKLCLVSVVAVTAYAIDVTLADVLSTPVALLITVGLGLSLASVLKAWLDRLFEFYPQGKTARQAAFSAAQRERSVDKLEAAFTSVLVGWGHADRAIIISGDKQSLRGPSLELDGDGLVMRAMRSLRWATPERLTRERQTAERVALLNFLTERQLGILVIEEGLALTVLAGVGISASRRPFTYPQVTQLMELASIMESALERAHFSAKIQHTEQLATVGLLGASLAHEIRNPLVSIKTFVQLLPTHHHDPAFREKFFKLIGDEVGRIDQLTEQLLDLSSPRAYAAEPVDLHPLLLSSLDLVAAKASHKDVRFLTEFQAAPDRAYTDASAAKQVMLNLCFNAIQAVDSHSAEDRWVKIATRNTSQGIEMAVADSGPGISPEIRPKLFQPFQTTKSSGFGLGLAICSDILTNLNASITVDPPEPGRGATFRVTFPCQP
jgi:signal transduction histidine kinase